MADAQKRLEAAQAQAEESKRSAEELSEQFEQARLKEASAREQLNSLVVARDQGRKALDQARQTYTQASAERTALEELERASESSNPLLAELLDARDESDDSRHSSSLGVGCIGRASAWR